MNAAAVQPWIQPVRLWPASTQRRVSWLELFFDVIFVAAVAQVGQPLSHDYSLSGLARYALMFLMIWWAWLGHTVYCTRFHTDDLIQRLLTFLQFFAVAIMAANARQGLETQDAAGFGAAYAVMRAVLVVQYLRARAIPKTRKLATIYAAGFGVAAIFWISAALAPLPLRYWLWSAAFLIDFNTPWFAGHHAHQAPTDAAHFPERFGLFTLILMGESVAAIMHGIESQAAWSPLAAVTAFSALGLMCALWWGYFHNANAAAERQANSKRERVRLRIWMHAHVAFYLALGVLGVGLEHAISEGSFLALHGEDAGILMGALVGVVGSLTVIGKNSGKAD
jgi:low temperature requirement protein LtrA